MNFTLSMFSDIPLNTDGKPSDNISWIHTPWAVTACSNWHSFLSTVSVLDPEMLAWFGLTSPPYFQSSHHCIKPSTIMPSFKKYCFAISSIICKIYQLLTSIFLPWCFALDSYWVLPSQNPWHLPSQVPISRTYPHLHVVFTLTTDEKWRYPVM